MENNNYRRPMHNNMNSRPLNRESNVKNIDNSDTSRVELMKAIMEASFYAQDLKLYLDTHPDDRRAIDMFREAVKQYKACVAAFEDSFYPLTANSAGKNGTWDWLCGNFPPLS